MNERENERQSESASQCAMRERDCVAVAVSCDESEYCSTLLPYDESHLNKNARSFSNGERAKGLLANEMIFHVHVARSCLIATILAVFNCSHVVHYKEELVWH